MALQQSIVNLVRWTEVIGAVDTNSPCVDWSIAVKTKCRGKVRTGFPRHDWSYQGALEFHTAVHFARTARPQRMLGSSGLEADLGVVGGLGGELGAIILRKDAVPAQQLV